MNSDIIEFIYNMLCERDMIKQNNDYKKANAENEEVFDKLKNVLKGEELKLLQKFDDTHILIEQKASETYFNYGIKFGVRLIIDLLYDN